MLLIIHSTPSPTPGSFRGMPSTMLHKVHFCKRSTGLPLAALLQEQKKIPIPLRQCGPAPQHEPGRPSAYSKPGNILRSIPTTLLYTAALEKCKSKSLLRSLHSYRYKICAFYKTQVSNAKSCANTDQKKFCALWTVAHQAPLSMEFSRQEYRNGLPFPPPGDLPDPGIEPGSPVLASSLPLSHHRRPKCTM